MQIAVLLSATVLVCTGVYFVQERFHTDREFRYLACSLFHITKSSPQEQGRPANKLGKGLRVVGSRLDDTIAGSPGNDRIRGEEGDDILFGKSGDDRLAGGDHNDTLSGDDGNDEIHGDGGKDTLRGGAGDDILMGGEDADHLEGDTGNDKLFGDEGNDFLVGGPGDDTYFFHAANHSYITNDGYDHISDRSGFADFDRLVFSSLGPDQIVLKKTGPDLADLEIRRKNSGERITIEKQFESGCGFSGIEVIEFQPEKSGSPRIKILWSISDIEAIAMAGRQ